MTAAPRVLVVEDHPLILPLAAETLASVGCEVISAATAEAALAALDAHSGRLSALVADIDLGSPDLTGFDVARRARELNPALPVIYASARAAEDVEAQGVPGAVYLPKPYCPARLCRQVAALLAAPAGIAA
ncbi:response regulator [Caulobacter sp. 17J80-11]|uniref:response regulator n=1 Tax=Caulobacter sp. 17J80-11 TaxID=2763502 RepID=UPI001653750D|nr:response regulator [Caulobacter sp. 17J80-11]MBC6981902.1 response regulator [Caulobacter sp. 17J80-11]